MIKRTIHIAAIIFVIFSFIPDSGMDIQTVRAQGEEPFEGSDMPGWPIPVKPIPHNEVGQVSRAASYQTTIPVEQYVVDQATGELTLDTYVEMVTLTGVDAMVADGLDPLAGNYNLVNWDSILISTSGGSDGFDLNTYKYDGLAIQTIGSEQDLGAFVHNDVAAADLNNDGQAEQIAVWVEGNAWHMRIGELPGAPARATSTPAVVVHENGDMDLLVRGYDEALWHRHYTSGDWGEWNNTAGGMLLSAPAVISNGDGSFYVFVLGSDNRTYQRYWNGSAWDTAWKVIDNPDDWPALDFWIGPTPDLSAPAIVRRGSGLDLFRLGPDNTLRWNHSPDGISWDGWVSLGGMLASGPGAVSFAANQMQVFARGVDESLWFRVYNGSWGGWQRASLEGMEAGVNIASAPTISASGDVYVRGSNEQIWHTQCDNSLCGSWDLIGAPTNALASGVALASGEWQFIVRTETGGLEYGNDGTSWTTWDGLESLSWEGTQPAPLTQIPVPRSTDIENLSIDVETGYLMGNGRPQVIVAYESPPLSMNTPATITIQIFEVIDGFQLSQIAERVIEGDRPSIATGDIDGDGLDEIVLVHLIAGNARGFQIKKLELLFNDNTIDWELSDPEMAGPSFGDAYHDFGGTLRITPGDFDGDGMDEMAIITDWNWQQHEGVNDDAHQFVYLYIFDNAQIPTTEFCDIDSNCPWALSFFGHPEDTVYCDSVGIPDAYCHMGVGNGLASGDMDGNGIDEIVVTWPTGTYEGDDWPDPFIQIKVLQMGSAITEVTNIGTYNIPNDGFRVRSFLDTLAVGDFDRDLINEIAFLEGNRGESPVFPGQLFIFEFTPPAAGETMGTLSLAGSFLSDMSTTRSVRMAVGNFTWEGIRVGRPSYRVQNRVDTMLALINMPPKHQDIVLDDSSGEYQVINSPDESCEPSPDSPNCTHAKYATENFESAEQELTTKHAYSISAGLETEACGSVDVVVASIESCVRNSINYTHGANFEKSTTQLSSTTFRRKVIAATDDKIVYFGTPYGVWEYPVLTEDSEDEASYITVAFPLVSMTQFPSTGGGYNNGFCDETWFHAGHQPNNIWSYDPFGEIRFEDYDPGFNPVYDVIEGDWAEGTITYAHLAAVKSSQEFSHAFSTSTEIEQKAEGDIKVVDLSMSYKAYVKGNYSTSSLQTDTLTATSNTVYSYFISPQPNGSQFNTRVLFYWAKDGYQVLDYQTEPGLAVNWRIYNKPDPAFILPWYGFPEPGAEQLPPCGSDQQLYSPDVVIEKYLEESETWFPVTAAEPGEVVRLTATVRNFSNEQADNILVRFYLGHPDDGGSLIGEETISNLARVNGSQQVSVAWTVTGVGKQKIYAVIDPENLIAEVHEAGDLIDNNIGYGLLTIGSAAYSDMGQAEEQPYDLLDYKMTETGLTVTLYMPRASQTAVTRYELEDAQSQVPVAGKVFQLIAYQGSQYRGWNEPIANFSLKPGTDAPPAVLALDTSGTNYPDNLGLWRWTNSGWMNAACPGYQVTSFPEDRLVFVPICQTGIYAFSNIRPNPLSNIPPLVQTILRLDPNPTSATSVDFRATFSESVTGVDVSDFKLHISGVIGASLSGVEGSGDTYKVSVNTGSQSGTIRLDVIDDDTIMDGDNNPLGGTGVGNGNYTNGESYAIEKPITPTLIAPNGTINGVAKPNFEWSVYPGATAYRLGLYSYAAASYLILGKIPLTYCNSTECTYPSQLDLSNGNYKFKVLAYTSSGMTPYSDWLPFTIMGVTMPLPPHPPIPISPSGSVTTHRPTLTWGAVDYATLYRLALYSNAAGAYLFVENVYPSCVAGVCSYTLKQDLVNGTYRFKLLARNSSGYTAYGSFMTFTISSHLPVAPTLLAPSGTVGANPPTFQWNSVSDATKYRLAVYSYQAGSYVVLTPVYPNSCGGGVCTYTPPTALASGNYKFKMLAYNMYGASNYSEFMSFVVP